jgi:hypothetical protein
MRLASNYCFGGQAERHLSGGQTAGVQFSHL